MPARALQTGTIHPAEILRQLQNEARTWSLRLELPRLATRVTLHWHARLRTTAGLARLDAALILLNPRLLALPDELISASAARSVATASRSPPLAAWPAITFITALPAAAKWRAFDLSSVARLA
jgi:hypothetical protein